MRKNLSAAPLYSPSWPSNFILLLQKQDFFFQKQKKQPWKVKLRKTGNDFFLGVPCVNKKSDNMNIFSRIVHTSSLNKSVQKTYIYWWQHKLSKHVLIKQPFCHYIRNSLKHFLAYFTLFHTKCVTKIVKKFYIRLLW